MRRVFSVIGFTALISLLILTNLSTSSALLVFLCALVGAVVFICIKATRKGKFLPVICFTVAFCGLFFSLFSTFAVEPTQKYIGKTRKIEATVVSMPEFHAGSFSYIVETQKVGNADIKMKIEVSSDKDLDVLPYDTLTGKVYLFSVNYNKGSDYAKGVYLHGRLKSVETTSVDESEKPLMYHLLMLRQTAVSNLQQGMDRENSPVAIGILLGDKTYLTNETYKQFQVCGIAHVLAVSGLHVTVLSGVLFSWLLKLRLNRRIAALLNFPIVFFYVALTGFSFSAMRAGLMLSVVYLGILLRREPDSLNTLGAVTFVLLLLNPYTAQNIGFLLSFSSVLGLVLIFAPISNFLKDKFEEKPKIIRKAVDYILCPLLQSISAILFCLPVSCYVFGFVSVISPLANMLIAPITHILLAACAVAALVPSLGWMANGPAWYIRTVAEKLSLFPYSTVSGSGISMFLWMSATLILVLVAYALYKYRQGNKTVLIRSCAMLSVIMLLTTTLTDVLLESGYTRITILDSGVGSCAVVTRGDSAIIIGGGGHSAEFVYSSFAERNVIRNVDVLAIPNDSSWHNTKTVELAKRAKPKRVLVSDRFANYYALSYVSDDIVDSDNTVTELWQDVSITVRHVVGSDVLLLKIGKDTILFIDKTVRFSALNTEERLADIVVFAGHVPDDYVKQTNQTAILCAEKNKYKSIADYTTCGQGNLIVYTRGMRDYSFRRASQWHS